MDRRRIIYYQDEQRDEFSPAQITPKKIDAHYRYCRDSFFEWLWHVFCYRIVATPIAWLYTKLKFHHKVDRQSRARLRACRRSGGFLYGNHTQDIADAFIPPMMTFPKKHFVIVHPNNVSMPVLGRCTPYLGALPLPDDMEAYRNFRAAIEKRIAQKKTVVIYPEAHIWPYYTGIRPFSDTSFSYPVKYNTPTYCFTNTYQKRRWSKKPRIVTYVDGPFFPDFTLPAAQQRKDLRDQVYACMTERAKCSSVVWIEYRKQEEAEHG